MSAPLYWMHETSGVLRPVIEAYLNREPLTEAEICVMRAYLRQWIYAPAWDANPYGTEMLAGLRDMIDSLHSRAQIETWLNKALDAGIDPL